MDKQKTKQVPPRSKARHQPLQTSGLNPEDLPRSLLAGHLDQDAVLALQDTIGNTAAQHVLAGQHPAQGAAAPQSGLPIQRKIGFEYQINASDVKPVNGIKRLKKGDAIGNKEEGLEPTVDVNQSNDYDLEFVSDAFDEDKQAGWDQFTKAVRLAAVSTTALKGAGARLASTVFAGGLNDHTVEVTGAFGVLHITQGIQLDKLHHFLTGFGFRGSKTKEVGDRPEKLADFTQQVIAGAGSAMDALEKRLGFRFGGTTRGEYLSVMGLIAGNMSRLGTNYGPYLKSYFKSMNRTDLGTLVTRVRTSILQEIQDNSPSTAMSPFTAGDIKALMQVPLWQVLNLNESLIPRMPFNEDENDWKKSGLGDITRLQWLDGLWNGDDMLSAKWHEAQALLNIGQKEEHEGASDILESVGAYGSKTDADQTGTSLRPIFEIRDIPNLPAGRLELWALALGEYIRNLNAGTETRPFYEVWQDINQ